MAEFDELNEGEAGALEQFGQANDATPERSSAEVLSELDEVLTSTDVTPVRKLSAEEKAALDTLVAGMHLAPQYANGLKGALQHLAEVLPNSLQERLGTPASDAAHVTEMMKQAVYGAFAKGLEKPGADVSGQARRTGPAGN